MDTTEIFQNARKSLEFNNKCTMIVETSRTHAEDALLRVSVQKSIFCISSFAFRPLRLFYFGFICCV